MNNRRVVVTGLGIVAPNGIGRDAFWRNLVAGKSGIDRIFAFDPSGYPCQVAAEVRDFSPADFMAPRQAKSMGRFSQLAVAATRLAVEDAKLSISSQTSDQIGIAWGTALAATGDLAADVYRGFFDHGVDAIARATAIEFPPHQAAVHLASEFKIHGPALTISTNCCTGLDAVYAGYTQIKLGKVKATLAGASDAPIFPATFGAFCQFGALTGRNHDPQGASRPFDKSRDGIVLGEGSATLVLEELESARARGAKIYAEILGHGGANELDSPRRRMTGRFMARAIRAALTEAGLAAGEVDHINAHGCGMPPYDICDTNAFKQVLGDHAYKIPITSIKSMVGQGLAAAGVLQTAAACLSIDHQRVPPTINQEACDPACDLDYVPNVSRAAAVNRVLINGQGFGGSYAALVIGRLGASDFDAPRNVTYSALVP